MNYRIIFLLALMTLLSCSNDKEFIISKYENGQIHEFLTLKMPITNDSIGFKKIFFKNGDLQCEGGYREGVRHGEWICYYKDRKIKWKSNYEVGEENGDVFCQNENGTWYRNRVKNGAREGKTTEFNFDSINNTFFYVYGQYENDLETGIWVWKDTLGLKTQERNFEKGISIGYFGNFYPNGNIQMKGERFFEPSSRRLFIKDTVFFYNEFEKEKIDSLDIYKKGKFKKTLRL